MSDLSYIIEILLKARDEATPKIEKLKATIDSLKATNDAENAEKKLGNAIDDTGRKEEARNRSRIASEKELANLHNDRVAAAERLHKAQSRYNQQEDATARSTTNRIASTEKLAQKENELNDARQEWNKTVAAEEAATRGAADATQEHGRAHGQASSAAVEHAKNLKQVKQDTRDLGLEAQQLTQSWKEFNKTVDSGELTKQQSKRGLREYGSEMDSLSRKVERGSQVWKDLQSAHEDVDKYLKKSDFGSTGGAFGAFKRGDISEGFEALDSHLGSLQVRVSGVASSIRGFFDLAKIGFSQQLITGIASLAGGLFSVASAAAQAGAALAGAFISGIGQAIPMVSVLLASVERFKSIIQLVSVTTQAEQQHFYDPTEKQRLQLQNASQLISSQQQLSNSYIQLFEAQQRVRDSQIALTEARYNAIRNITDLSLAEKNARLEAQGANISLIESKRRLQEAIQRGDTAGLALAELSVKQAELGKTKAEFEVPKAEREARLARQRGVTGAPTVISAVEGFEGAKLSVTQAHQAAEAAQRQEQITKLQQQARSSQETQFEAQKKYLEKQMSPAELGLAHSLSAVLKELKSPSSPLQQISDSMVAPFANALSRIRELLKTPSFLQPLEALGKAMGTGLGRLEKLTYGPQGTSFFETMARDAAKSIPIVVSAIEKIMILFERIAETAAPAFRKLSEDWNKFWGGLATKYSTPQGFIGLEKFFNKSVEYAEAFGKLASALGGLFKALGHDAAPQGLSSVSSFTDSIKAATDWVKSHGPEVTKFFREAKEGLSLIAEMLLGIGVAMVKVFNLNSLAAFKGFLTEILLPGLRDVVNLLGFMTTKALEFFNSFGGPGRKILEIIGASGVIVYGIIKIVAVIESVKKAWAAFVLFVQETKWASVLTNPWLAALAVVSTAIVAVFSTFSSKQKEVKTSTEEANQALENQANALRTIKNLNNEYKSSKLGVEEAATQYKVAQQDLAKARHEGIQKGETPAEYALKVQGARQQVSRSKLSLEEREREYKKLPEAQSETSARSLRETSKAVTTAQNRYNELSREVNTYRRAIHEEGGLTPQANQKRIQLEKELTEAKNTLTTASKKQAEAVRQSGEIISSSALTTAKAAPKLSEAYEEAFRKFGDSIKGGESAARGGMSKIRSLVDNALRKYGVSPAEVTGAPGALSTLPQSGGPGPLKELKPLAQGSYVRARPGGHIARIGEGGHDEAVISTDPRHAARSRQILGQYYRAAPHMAGGGSLAGVTGSSGSGYLYPFHGATFSRTDMGIDANMPVGAPITAIGESLVKGILPNWYAGQPYIWAELLSGPLKGKLYYVAEQINKLARVGSILKAGQALAYYAPSGTGIEAGWASAGGATLAQAEGKTGDATHGNAPAGIAFRNFITGLAHGKIIAGQGGAAIQKLVAPLIKGGAAVGRVAQSALNIATKAANIYLGKKAPGGEEPGSPLTGGNVGAQIMNFFTGHGLTRAQAAGIIGNAMQESSLNPNAPGGGLFQDIGGRGAGQGAGIAAQLQATWRELTSTESATLAALKKTHSPGEAALLFSKMFERPGEPNNAARERYADEAFGKYAMGGFLAPHRLVTDHLRRIVTRHFRRKLLKFAEGGRAPWGGRPIPIIAHEGERIMNPMQYHETARLAGTSPGGLDRHLGFDGRPRQHFVAGGIPRVVSQHAQSGHEVPFTAPTFPELLNFSEGNVGSINIFLKVFKALAEGFKKIGKLKPEGFANEITKFVDLITVEGTGVLAQLLKGREILKAKLGRAKVSAAYEQSSSIPAHAYQSGKNFVKILGGEKDVVKLGPKGLVGIEEATLRELTQENTYMEKEARVINETKSKVKTGMKAASKIKDSGKRSVALTHLQAQYNSLSEKQRELAETMSQNIEARYQAETQIIQDKITEANNAYQVISTEQTTALSKAQSYGRFGETSSLESQIRQSAEGQISTLQPILAEAEKIGNRELAATVKSEIANLRSTISSAVVEQFSIAQQAIQRESAKAEAVSGERLGLGKVAAQEGNFLAAGALEKEGLGLKASNLASTRSKMEGLLRGAEGAGDEALVISLTEELNKNSTEIAENNLALKESAVITRELITSQIEQTGQFKTGIYKTAISGLEIIGKTTGFTNVKAMLEASKGEGGALKAEREGLVGQAGTMGLNVSGMSPEQILAYLASPQGQSQISQIERGADKAEKEQFYKLTDALETNATATLQNAEQTARLNGQLNQPQTWGTAAWSQFRTAFFTGMGQLLPQYQSALPPGSRPEGLPNYGIATPGKAIPAIGNLNITHPVETLNPQLLGEQIAFHISTTPAAA